LQQIFQAAINNKIQGKGTPSMFKIIKRIVLLAKKDLPGVL
jgi:hypothetical protein